MTGPIHTYGPTCLLFNEKPDPSVLCSSLSPPRLNVQYFYASTQPIDDPLSPVPPSGSTSSTDGTPLQPFSAKDNSSLEVSWLAARNRQTARRSGNSSPHMLGVVPEGRQVARSDGASDNLDVHVSGPDGVDGSEWERTVGNRKRQKSPVDVDSHSVKRKASPSTGVDVHYNPSRAVSPNGSQHLRDPVGRLQHISPKHSVQSNDQFRSWSSRRDDVLEHTSPGASPTRLGQATTEGLQNDDRQEIVPVGVSRLHLVELPNLKVWISFDIHFPPSG